MCVNWSTYNVNKMSSCNDVFNLKINFHLQKKMKTVAASVLQQHINAVLASSGTTIAQQKQVDGCADTSDDDGSDVSDDKSDNDEDDDENLQVRFKFFLSLLVWSVDMFVSS